MLNDFERLVAGPPGLDLAAVLMGTWHYGFPPGSFEQFRRGYGPDAPTRDQALPCARLRELSGLLVALLQADRDPAMAQQVHVRAACLNDPGAGTPWTFIGDHAAMRLLPAEAQPQDTPGSLLETDCS
ncbi:MAG: aminoglycoside phosphotransferase family protein [Actinomycetota bacterium]|nr:aminoglycoside phosphotransferase family protein [Actinomycetota bacterium]